ncbi:MAG TPA: D-alanyl-D-alanine carboxypeptidase [Clostridiales bacterium]|nr:D-alanyl-D-alanine carboxypeptidase [Clostridiales bacterium]
MKKSGIFRRFFTLLLIPLLLIVPVTAGPGDDTQTSTGGTAEEPVFQIVPVSLEKDQIPALSAILIDLDSRTVLYEKDADLRLPPASITKIMTMLLVIEAIKAGHISWEDQVVASEHASRMGGSQIYLEAGEVMTVDELYKSVSIASANDAAVALAEHVSGSESVFVARMNERAKELGMTNTVFKNASGLDDQGHESSARDVALMSAALAEHPEAFKYTTTWIDSVRNGEFGLTNTNKLVRSYKGITGLKTGSTGRAKYCVSATAERNGLRLAAVIMGSDTTAERFNAAATLLDYGYATFERVDLSEGVDVPDVKVKHGTVEKISPIPQGSVYSVIPKGAADKLTKSLNIEPTYNAPLSKGDSLGSIEVKLDGKHVGRVPLVAGEDVPRLTFWKAFAWLLAAMRLF